MNANIRARIAVLRSAGLHASADALVNYHMVPKGPEPRYHLVAINTENQVRTQITRRPLLLDTCERMRRKYKPSSTRHLVIEKA